MSRRRAERRCRLRRLERIPRWRNVESDSLLEGAFEFGGGDRHRFEVPENIGEPQADKPNVALFQGTKHEFFLAIHARETKQATLNLCYISGPG